MNDGLLPFIGYDWLKANIPMDKTMLEKWLAAGYLEEQKVFLVPNREKKIFLGQVPL